MDKNSVEYIPPTTPQETHQWNKHTQAEISGVHTPRSLELQKASGVTQTPRVHHPFRATTMQSLTPWHPGLQKHTHLLNPGGQKSPQAFKDQNKNSNPLGWVLILSPLQWRFVWIYQTFWSPEEKIHSSVICNEMSLLSTWLKPWK